jgi:hypothetical protein
MGFKERVRYLGSCDYHMVFDRSGNATSVILIDGEVAGIWDHLDDGPTVKVFLMRKLSKDIQRRVEKEAKRLGSFIFDQDKVRSKRCRSMKALDKRTAGSFQRPLKDS